MFTVLNISRRYLQAGPKSRFFSIIGLLSIFGVAIGVAAMIVVLSVINGFEKELRNRFLAANAHILAFQYPSGLENPEAWIRKIQRDFPKILTGMSPFVHNETMIKKDSLLHNVLIKGIDPERRERVQDATQVVRPAEALNILKAEMKLFSTTKNIPEVPGLILGRGLLSVLNAKVGDTVELVAPESQSLGELRKFKIIGIYDSGLKHYDNKLGLMSLTTAQKFFQMKERVTGIEIGLKNPQESLAIADKMQSIYAISIKDWQSFNKPMFEAMQMERAVIGLIVALVAFVASFNILTTLFISVSQRQKSISILKALGASHSFIFNIFLIQSFVIGALGSLVGGILAFVLSYIIAHYKIVELPDLYHLSQLPISYNPTVYGLVCAGGLGICLLAGIYPAYVASRVTIVEGLSGK